MSDIPDDLVWEILSRLTVAPLLRFRCVSKSWKDLIDSPQFIKQHLDHSCISNSNLYLISRYSYILSADFDLINETNVATFQSLSHSFEIDITTEMLGCCHGLIALSNSSHDGNYEDIIVWNPSTRRFYRLPVSIRKAPFIFRQFIVYGFGYDSLGDDYKFVRMSQFCGMGDDYFDAEVKVYSLKSQSWKGIPNLSYYLKYTDFGLIANDALHWIVSRRRVDLDTDSLIIAFHLGTEEYKLVPLPEFGGDDFKMKVQVLGGCLSVMCHYSKFDRHVEIWVMKEYGVKRSWSILFKVRQFDIGFGRFNSFRPIAYSKCGRKVLLNLNGRTLLWYDLDNKSAELPVVHYPLDIMKGYLELYTCMQSLVMPDGGGTWNSDKVTEKARKEGQKEKFKKKDDYD